MRARFALIAAAAFAWATPVCADYTRGKAAHERWSDAEAEVQYEAGVGTGEGASMRELAWMYRERARFGEDPPRWTAKALALLERAVATGDAEAQWVLGYAHLADPNSREWRIDPYSLILKPDVRRGVELLRASCARGAVQACVELTRIYVGGRETMRVNNVVLPNPSEAARAAAAAEPLLRARAAKGDAAAMTDLGRSYPWPTVTPDEREMFALIGAWARGGSGAGVLKAAGDPVALEQRAAHWEIEHGLRPRTFDMPSMIATITGALGTMDGIEGRVHADAFFHALEAFRQLPRNIDMRRNKALIDSLTQRFTPISAEELRASDATATRAGLDVRAAFAADLQNILTPRQLHYLASFFTTDAGRKLLEYKPTMRRLRIEALTLSIVAGPARGLTHPLAPSYRAAWESVAANLGVNANLDVNRDGGRMRAAFAEEAGLFFPGEEPGNVSMIGEAFAMLGPQYDKTSRLLTRSQCAQVDAVRESEAWPRLFNAGAALRAKIRALPANRQSAAEAAEKRKAIVQSL